MKNPRHQCTLTCPDGRAFEYIMNKPTVDKHFCSAFFVVRVTHNEERANMALQSETAQFIKTSMGKLKITGKEHNVQIPILVNTSIIKAGEELLCYLPEVKPEPTVKKIESLQLNAPKRAKVS